MMDDHYDVVLSFAGEDRVYAQELAAALQRRGVKVFYDYDERAKLWGANLYDQLSDLYQNKADFCVMFLSQHYAVKPWTKHERRAAQARAFREEREYILAVRLDDTEVEGILPTTAFVRWSEEGAEGIAEAIVQKLRILTETPAIASEQRPEKLMTPLAATPQALSMQEARRKVTAGFANELIDDQPVIAREDFQNKVDQFLASPTRYGVVLGPSGVGKSTAMALEARRLIERGWTVLLLRGSSFSLEYAAELVRRKLTPSLPQLDWHQIVQPWTGESTATPSGFALLMDAIDVADREHISHQLALLHDSIIDAPLERLKVIVSCRDVVWDGFLRDGSLPFSEEVERIGRPARRGYQILRISDFKPDELDRALQRIGATELLAPRSSSEQIDPHIATLRDLLTHPATFEHYANLHVKGDLSAIQNATWSGLIEARLGSALRQVGQQCGKTSEELREQLIALAAVGWEQKARDFILDAGIVKSRLPDLFVTQENSEHSPHIALLRGGVLLESPSPSGGRSISFRITDAGGYLLSFTLEQQSVNKKNTDDFRELVTEWLHEAWDYPPLLDAVLAWVDRLSVTPRSPQLLLLLEAILDTTRSNSVFRLVRPIVLGSLFELIKRGDEDDFYKYREAAIAVRSSPEALAVIRRHLRDPHSQARQLAAKLVGLHRDEASISELISLLEDEDENVRHEVFVTFGQVGKAAVPLLLTALSDPAKAAEFRSRYLVAVRNIGFRSEEVSVSLSRCLSAAQGGDAGFLRSALLTAAHLRDRHQTCNALVALKRSEEEVVHAAAKLLTEAPDPAAFNVLRESLRPPVPANGLTVARPWLTRQLMAALIGADRSAAEPVVVEMIRQGLEGSGELSPVEAVQAAEKFGIAAAYPLVLDNVVTELRGRRERNLLWRTTEMLGATWRPSQLAALAEATRNLSAQGIDIAQLFVDAIAPNMRVHDEFPMGDRLNRAKDLLTAAKCQAPNFVPEVSRLLGQASELSTAELCRFLWLAGDSRAEAALLDKLAQPAPEGRLVWYARNAVVRALGTCGTARSAEAVLAYLRSEQDISIYFHQETLYPLLLRGVLSPSQLAGVVRAPEASVGGRTASLLALGVLDAPGNKDLFVEFAGDGEDEMLQRYAVRMLGFTKDTSVVTTLRRLLRTSSRLSIKSQAAEALGWLDAREAVHDIEEALEDSDGDGFVSALAHFRESSSLPLLLNRLSTAPGQSRLHYLRALGAFSRDAQGARAIRERFEEWAAGTSGIFDDQGPLIEGLAEHEPNMLLENFNVRYDRGQVTAGGRQALARSIPLLFRLEATNKTLLLEAVKRLMCDRDVAIRDRAMHTLSLMDRSFCQQVHDELRYVANADEWGRACAVRTLGYWESNVGEIESARYDKEFLVRRAADEALVMRQTHRDLQAHINNFRSADGLVRLATYLCLKDYGGLSAIWALHEEVPRGTLAHAFVQHTVREINERLRKEYRKRQDEEEKLSESRGTVWFD